MAARIRKRRGPALVLTVFNRKGGACKTTTSLNLAAWLAARGFYTAYIEFDDNAKAYAIMVKRLRRTDPPLNPARTSYALFYPDKYPIQEAPVELDAAGLLDRTRIRKDHLEGICRERGWEQPNALDFFPGTSVIRHIEYEFARAELLAEEEGAAFAVIDQVRRSLLSLREQYDIIVCDTPPSLTTVLLNVLSASDYGVIPVELLPTSIDDYDETIRTFNRVTSAQVAQGRTATRLLGAVACRKEDLAGHDQVLAEYTQDHKDPETGRILPPAIEVPMLGVVPLDTEAVIASETIRVPIVLSAPRRAVGDAYAQFCLNVEHALVREGVL